MTHVLEIGAINPYEKTSTILTGTKLEHCPVGYQKLVPEKFGTEWHVKHVKNRFMVPVYGTDFW